MCVSKGKLCKVSEVCLLVEREDKNNRIGLQFKKWMFAESESES